MKRIETDLVIIGSGGGGMMTALTAHRNGLDAVIIEKSKYYGGSTALSGGAIWIPCSEHLANDGIEDNETSAAKYLSKVVNGHASEVRQRQYIKYGPEMVKILESETHLKFRRCHGYADYFPDFEGGLDVGRSLEPDPFNLKELGNDAKYLNPPIWPIPGGMALTAGEYNKINVMNSTWAGKKTMLKIIWRRIKDFFTFKKTTALGQALMGRFRLSLKDRKIPIHLETAMKGILVDERRKVYGVIAERNGEQIEYVGRKGVVLACGGFPRDLEMRKKYLPEPQTIDWTNANEYNTGDGIKAAEKLNVALDLMDDAWWGPCSILPDGKTPFFHVGERSLPGAIIVNQQGKRFLNEAEPYTDFVHHLYEKLESNESSIPCYFIMDQRFRNKYPFGLLPAGINYPKFKKSGYLIKAKTLEELARKLDLPSDNLLSTMKRFNDMARKGVDEDFGKGNNAYDRYYGDPTVHPNPCLHPLEKPPYYAVKLYPGDLGTKGGILTDEFARALNTEDEVIDGLYVIGNCSASLMGRSYPGAGGTIGPAMIFGHIAALHAVGKLEKEKAIS